MSLNSITNQQLPDVTTMDKSHWVCLKFPDNSVYYGEVAFFDQNGHETVEPEDKERITKGEVKKMRHGFGV